MRSKRLSGDMWALVCDKGDDPVAEIERFAREREITAAALTGIGAFERVVLGYFDRARKEYARIPLDEQVEVLSLLGDIAVADGEPKLHLHVVVGTADGTARGGHLLEASVWPTLEVVLTRPPAGLRKRHDPETGLALIDPLA
jgi:predicted DNA-binding protein with PD1-like motif